MVTVARIQQNNQCIIPTKVREVLNIKKGDTVGFYISEIEEKGKKRNVVEIRKVKIAVKPIS